VTSEGSEFQTDGAEHQKARFASSVLVNGTVSSKVSDERNVRVDCVSFIVSTELSVRWVGNGSNVIILLILFLTF